MLKKNIQVIAHRGASACAPENTFAAFDLALRMGAVHLELDVRISADGHPVVIHDETLKRTTGGKGLVFENTLEDLKRLDAGSWFSTEFVDEKIPSFIEVLEKYAGPAHIHAELKGVNPELPLRVIQEIRKSRTEEDVTLISFETVNLDEIRNHAPDIKLGLLSENITDEIILKAENMNINALYPNAQKISHKTLKELQRKGFAVRAWGVKSMSVMLKMVSAGADGIILDFPDKLIACLKKYR